MGTATLTTDGNIVTEIQITEGQGSQLFAWASYPDGYGYPVV